MVRKLWSDDEKVYRKKNEKTYVNLDFVKDFTPAFLWSTCTENAPCISSFPNDDKSPCASRI